VHKEVKYWYDNYAQGSPDDQRSVENFCVCESTEAIRIFQNELIGIMNGNHRAETLDIILGKDRVLKHGTYEEWAKLMLRWMAEARKQP
jgi:hypothetical protein